MDAVLSAFAAALDRRTDGTTLMVMAGPHHVETVGVLADVVFMDDATLEGPRAVLVLCDDATYAAPHAALAILRSRVAAITRAALDRPLDETLGARVLAPGTDLPIEREAIPRHAATLARLRALDASPWIIPPAITALAALFAAPSTLEQAALRRLHLVPTPWLATLAIGAPALGATLTAALKIGRGTQVPEEFVALVPDLPSALLGYWFDAPARPKAPARFELAETALLDGALFDPILLAIDRALAEPGLSALELLELDALRTFAHAAAATVPPGSGYPRAP